MHNDKYEFTQEDLAMVNNGQASGILTKILHGNKVTHYSPHDIVLGSHNHDVKVVEKIDYQPDGIAVFFSQQEKPLVFDRITSLGSERIVARKNETVHYLTIVR